LLAFSLRSGRVLDAPMAALASLASSIQLNQGCLASILTSQRLDLAIYIFYGILVAIAQVSLN
jgi:hypothetical protein